MVTSPSGGFLPTPPLGLLDLAGGEVLRIPGSRVKIIDMEGDNLSIEETVNAALEMKPDIVGGITLHATAAHVNASIIARKIKERSPETLLVAGGVTTPRSFPRRSCAPASTSLYWARATKPCMR